MNLFKKMLLSLAFVMISQLAWGQNASVWQHCIESTEDFPFSSGEVLTIDYIEINTIACLSELAERLQNSNFPLVAMKNEQFRPAVDIVKNRNLQIAIYEEREEEWQNLESIYQQKFERLEEIAGLQEQRVENHKLANQQLLDQIDLLNEQLDRSVELTNRSLRGRQFRNVTMAATGGVIGFSLGVLVVALVK